MSPQTMLDEKERINDSDHSTKDAQVKSDMEKAMPHNMEKAWRLTGNNNYYMGVEFKDANKVKARSFDPTYDPCPWPVKKNDSGGWNKENVERCNHRIPANLPPLERQGFAEIHCRAHLDYYFEYYGLRAKDGSLRPPATTKINPPQWANDDIPGDDPTAPNRERVRMRVEARLKEERKLGVEHKEEIVTQINELNEQKSGRGRGRPRKEVTDGEA